MQREIQNAFSLVSVAGRAGEQSLFDGVGQFDSAVGGPHIRRAKDYPRGDESQEASRLGHG